MADMFQAAIVDFLSSPVSKSTCVGKKPIAQEPRLPSSMYNISVASSTRIASDRLEVLYYLISSSQGDLAVPEKKRILCGFRKKAMRLPVELGGRWETFLDSASSC